MKKPSHGPATGRPAEPAPRLPHERDERSHVTAPTPDPMIEQAKRDVDAGLVDTDLRATEGTLPERRKALVADPQASVEPARPATRTPKGTPRR
jgi:hypothetical protein